ncbi:MULTISPECIES: ketopantoate reductase family protein [Bosea]|jgi:2-dehydropantoate 2-reductase|uniref:2-dehydropantoate 2-reductase n=1 Tax=Bosea vaviloviae TaxID=1526658 RepID=A0A0N1F5B9_9HYPH|nr:2-dehydropantoate 2-reductase [Bosea vaviloviae]KPH80983.1 2-dehydropantoate 2-reductase [Bosea vaviloviae]
MRIAIMGSGGVGGYFGARLAANGEDVTFIARGAHLDALRTQGLVIESGQGNVTLPSVAATDDPAAIGSADLVIVGVKLWDTEAAARAILPLVQNGASVVSFQNGVRKDDILRDIVGPKALLGGVTYIAASIARPGVIRHVGTMQKLVFGEFDGAASTRTQAFLDACLGAGIDAQLSPDIGRATWEKFVFLAGLSGATTAMRSSIGPIRKNPRARAFLLGLMQEVVAVGRASGVALAEDFAEDRLAFCDTLPEQMTSSMHGDLDRGSKLELPFLGGSVVELGARLGVPTPLNRAVEDILALYQGGHDAR